MRGGVLLLLVLLLTNCAGRNRAGFLLQPSSAASGPRSPAARLESSSSSGTFPRFSSILVESIAQIRFSPLGEMFDQCGDIFSKVFIQVVLYVQFAIAKILPHYDSGSFKIAEIL